MIKGQVGKDGKGRDSCKECQASLRLALFRRLRLFFNDCDYCWLPYSNVLDLFDIDWLELCVVHLFESLWNEVGILIDDWGNYWIRSDNRDHYDRIWNDDWVWNDNGIDDHDRIRYDDRIRDDNWIWDDHGVRNDHGIGNHDRVRNDNWIGFADVESS